MSCSGSPLSHVQCDPLQFSSFCHRCVWLWEFVLLGSLCLQEQLAQPRHVDHLVRLDSPSPSFRTRSHDSHLHKDSAEHALH